MKCHDTKLNINFEGGILVLCNHFAHLIIQGNSERVRGPAHIEDDCDQKQRFDQTPLVLLRSLG